MPKRLSPLTDPASVNYTKEAFLNPWNLGFLLVIMLTAFFLSGLGGWQQVVLLFGLAAELIFLGTVPRSSRFRRYIRSQQAQKASQPPSQNELFRRLSKPSQKRFIHLRNLERSIKGNYEKLNYAAQGMLESHLQKIDNLLTSYLDMLFLKERYEQFASSTTQQEVKRSMARLQEELPEDSPRVRSIKKRRLTVLEKRLQRYQHAGENLEVLQAQVETIEDVVRFIHEQSITMNNPEEITFQLDTLLSDVEETQASVDELNDLFNGSTEGLLEEIGSFTPAEEQESPQQQNSRLKNS